MYHVPFEQIQKDGLAFIHSTERTVQDTSYHKTYPEFLRYFECIDTINFHHLVIASHFVYGRMPTILTLDYTKQKETTQLLNKAKKGHALSTQETVSIMKCVNNSLVGTSKLLHCINPHLYAIRDSHILQYLTGKKSGSAIKNPEQYQQYCGLINDISYHHEYPSLHADIEKYCGYPLTPMRAIEIIMFETNKRRRKIHNSPSQDLF